jgi:hypothetical protein
MQISIKTIGLDDLRDLLGKLSGPEMRMAQAKAINDTAFQVRRQMLRELGAVFDRPTPFIARSPKVVMATPDNLSARILPTMDSRNRPSKGGKVGVDPQQVLQAQEFGGRRADKRSEVALRRAGILPAGYQTSIPREPFPGSDDGRGNLRGAFLSQMISYLQASPEQGYRLNMTRRRKEKLADRTSMSSIATRKTLKTIRGVVYFVAYGSLRGGATSHLQPGVWAKTGIHGAEIKPVLMFVRTPSYRPLLSMERIADSVDVDAYLARRLRFRLREAAGI